MAKRTIPVVLAAAVIAIGMVRTAGAQDAAESAIILSGGGPSQAGAQRSLSAAIANGFNSAGSAIGAANGNTVVRRHTSWTARPRDRAARATAVSPLSDPLADTNAPTYQLANGASIRVSGGLRPEPNTTCVRNCH